MILQLCVNNILKKLNENLNNEYWNGHINHLIKLADHDRPKNRRGERRPHDLNVDQLYPSKLYKLNVSPDFSTKILCRRFRERYLVTSGSSNFGLSRRRLFYIIKGNDIAYLLIVSEENIKKTNQYYCRTIFIQGFSLR